MERSKRRGRGEWEKIVGEQAGSGLSAAAFCRDKAIGLASFYHWRQRLRKMVSGPVVEIDSAGTFIDMGQIDSSAGSVSTGGQAWIVTLDLGEGFKLTLQRS
jgi:hypothetical protein